MKKIFFFADILYPYRIAWINELNKLMPVDCVYINVTEEARTEEWLNSIKMDFPAKNYHDLGYKNLVKNYDNYDIYLIDGYSNLKKLWYTFRLLRKNKKVFITIDGIVQKERQNILKKWIKKKIFNSGAYFLCGSHIAGDILKENGTKEDHIFYHTFTSFYEKDVEKCKEEYKKALSSKQKDTVNVIAVGRFIPLKNYDVLLRAWKDVQGNANLTIIGGGPERENYEKIIKELDLKNVTLIDYLSKEELLKEYAKSDIFVHPTSTDVWGLVINESMACGLPVITTDNCIAGIELIKDYENGFVVPVGDEKSLTDKINILVSDSDLRQKMAQNNLEKIKDFTYENMAKTHFDIFNKFLNK
jgi:glycosyltransferase involved in cell wall biosynthesis